MGTTTVLPAIYASNLTLAVCFVCMGAGLMFLRRVAGAIAGPGYWAAGLFLNAAGFVAWAATITDWNREFFLLGELLHIIGFAALVLGIYRFMGKAFQRRHFAGGCALAAMWIFGLMIMPQHRVGGLFLIMLFRTLIFVWAGQIILKQASSGSQAGRSMAGWGLVAWGVYAACAPVIWQFSWLRPMAVGLPAGLHVVVVMGMVLLIIEQMQARAEASEQHAQRLEGLLPICAACKKIRDDRDVWHPIEGYIQHRSKAEFSHSICPDCARRLYPELDIYPGTRPNAT
ncbi:hypothetical protein HNR65_001289 [Desulfosalsimonas propionicica]|uniref:Uncharacterized protein n=1 Tax=Desulfosalsimonas propionicica TaxID=332175 RepID=A0A7W0C881_9BACT|nr:hypothetical protein [Desulfosalsimonas propionicica]MBA2880963.1 hypothetical protein [Desulfosalsimonas propionicica]